jgi:hypothetical protein
MTLDEAQELMAYWQRHPPTNEIAAAWAGYRAPSSAQAPTRELTPVDAAALVAQFNEGGMA